MKYLAPRSIPAFSQIVPALGGPSPREISRYLEVTERTVYRWQASDDAPRAALLALFWESSYGLSAIDCELHNAAQVHKNHAQSLVKELVNLRRRIAFLEKNGRFDCSNQPFFPPVALPLSAFS